MVDTPEHPVTLSCPSNQSSVVVEGDETFTAYVVMARIDGVTDEAEPVVRQSG